MTMARLRLYALATVGAFFIVYELLTEAMSPQGPSLVGFVWIFIFIPMYAVGVWLTWRLPTHPQPVRLLVAGTTLLTGDAFSSLLASQPSMINSPWFPVLSMLSLLVGTAGILAVALLIGSYPDGVVERVAESGPAMLLAGSPRPTACSACVTRSPGVRMGRGRRRCS